MPSYIYQDPLRRRQQPNGAVSPISRGPAPAPQPSAPPGGQFIMRPQAPSLDQSINRTQRIIARRQDQGLVGPNEANAVNNSFATNAAQALSRGANQASGMANAAMARPQASPVATAAMMQRAQNLSGQADTANQFAALSRQATGQGMSVPQFQQNQLAQAQQTANTQKTQAEATDLAGRNKTLRHQSEQNVLAARGQGVEAAQEQRLASESRDTTTRDIAADTNKMNLQITQMNNDLQRSVEGGKLALGVMQATYLNNLEKARLEGQMSAEQLKTYSQLVSDLLTKGNGGASSGVAPTAAGGTSVLDKTRALAGLGAMSRVMPDVDWMGTGQTTPVVPQQASPQAPPVQAPAPQQQPMQVQQPQGQPAPISQSAPHIPLPEAYVQREHQRKVAAVADQLQRAQNEFAQLGAAIGHGRVGEEQTGYNAPPAYGADYMGWTPERDVMQADTQRYQALGQRIAQLQQLYAQLQQGGVASAQ